MKGFIHFSMPQRLAALFSIVMMLGIMLFPGVASAVVAPVNNEITCGTAVVDGDYGEWDLTEDFFAEMHEAGAPNKAHLSNLYLRYDVTTARMNVLVLREGNWVPDASANDAWVKIYDLGQSPQVDGNSSDFQWVYDGNTLIGYEAAFAIPNGWYAEVEAHINVDGGRTSSTGKKNKGGYISWDIDCPEPPTPDPGSITIFKYHDLNNNGQYDEGSESGLQGWEFSIGDETQTTGSDGTATFENVMLGQEYEVCETFQTGWVNTDPSDGSGCKTVTAGSSSSGSSASSETVVNVSGNTYTIEFLGTSNGGLTWNYQVSETTGKSLSHWVLGLCMPETDVVSWEPTGSGIEGVEIGNDPTTGVFGIKWDLNDNYDNSGGEEDDSRIFSFTLSSVYPEGEVDVAAKTGGRGAQSATSTIIGPDCSASPTEPVMFGNYQEPVVLKSSLGDRVWFDENDNGIQDEGETGVEDVTVKLYTCAGDAVAELSTDANGNYLFENLSPGEYYVEFSDLPNGYVLAVQGPTGTSDPTDSDAGRATLKTECTALEPGEEDLTWDAGIVKGAKITKYQRLDDSDAWTVDPLFGLHAGDTFSYQIEVENLSYDENLGLTILDTLSELIEFDGNLVLDKVDVDGNVQRLVEGVDYEFNYDLSTRELSLDYYDTVAFLPGEALQLSFDVMVSDGFGGDMTITNQADVAFTGHEKIASNIVEAYGVPEPGTVLLLGTGLLGLLGWRRKKKGKNK